MSGDRLRITHPQGALGAAHGPRGSHRLDDQGRLVGPVRRLPHGKLRRAVCGDAAHLAGGAGALALSSPHTHTAEHSNSLVLQDVHAEESYARSLAAISAGSFEEELTPLTVPKGKAETEEASYP